jgi:hypothetical protein
VEETNLVDADLAGLFIKTVQGDYSLESCVVLGDKLVKSDQPVAWHAEPNLTLLSRYLRATSTLPSAIEEWLIALFNQNYATWGGRDDRICRVKEIRRRGRGRPWNARYPTWASSLPSETLQAFEGLKNSKTEEGEFDDLTIFSLVLARNRPLSSPVREWLAETFNPESEFDFRIRAVTRRMEGSKPIGPNPSGWRHDAVREVMKLRKQGMSRKSATCEVAISLNKPFDTVAYAVDLGPDTHPSRKK